MENQSLGYYLANLEKCCPQENLKLPEPIDRDFTFMALVEELDKKDFPPVVSGKIKGYDIPIVSNIFASRKRIANILGLDNPEDISPNWNKIEGNLLKPEIVDNGPVQDVVITGEEIDAGKFPWMQYYKTDAGRYISSGIVVAKDPDTDICNLSFHRMQYKDKNKFGISLHSRQHLFHYYQRAEQMGKGIDVAIIVGAHPAVTLAAAAKPAIEVDEYDIAGSILGEPLRLVQGKTVDVAYPAQAEIVLEGKILPTVREPEGPFGEFTGYSTSRSTENVFIITAICHRKNPIYEIIAPGATKDHLYLARVAREAATLQRLKERIPWVKDIAYPKSGVNFHCYVSLSECPAGVAKQALTLLMGLDHYIKLAVAVDEDIDINQDQDVLWAISTRCQMQKDLFIIPESFIISLDPTSINNTNYKVAIDATMSDEMRKEITILEPEKESKLLAAEILRKLNI